MTWQPEKKNAKYKEAYSRQILYSARRRALAGSARERRDMGHGLLAQGPSVFHFLICFRYFCRFSFFPSSIVQLFFWFLVFQTISNLNNLKRKYNFLFEYISILNKIWILKELSFEQILDLNNFHIWTYLNFWIWTNFYLNKF
jgi:hypothetical protein